MIVKENTVIHCHYHTQLITIHVHICNLTLRNRSMSFSYDKTCNYYFLVTQLPPLFGVGDIISWQSMCTSFLHILNSHWSHDLISILNITHKRIQRCLYLAQLSSYQHRCRSNNLLHNSVCNQLGCNL